MGRHWAHTISFTCCRRENHLLLLLLLLLRVCGRLGLVLCCDTLASGIGLCLRLRALQRCVRC